MLARELGMTVSTLTTEMTSDEFLAWRDLYMIEAEERDRAEHGEPVQQQQPKRLVTDAGEIRRWFQQNA